MLNTISDNSLTRLIPTASEIEDIENVKGAENLKVIKNIKDVERLFSKIEIRNINLYKSSKTLEVLISSNWLISVQMLEQVEKTFADHFNLNSVNIDIKYNIPQPIEELIPNYWEDIIYELSKKTSISRGILIGSECEISDRQLKIHLKNRGKEILKSQGCGRQLEEIVERLFSKRIKVVFQDRPVDENYKREYLEQKEHEEAKVLRTALNFTNNFDSAKKNIDKNHRTDKTDSSYISDYPGYGTIDDGLMKGGPTQGRATTRVLKKESPKKSYRPSVIIGKLFNSELLELQNINENSGPVAFTGDIINIKFTEIRRNRHICTFDVTNYISSLTVKFFIKNNKLKEIKEKIKEGITVKVKGEASYDRYSRDMVITASDILQIKKEHYRMDDADVKRVELHLHTRMSSMDAVSPVEDLVKRAAKWDHKAIAITDHGVVQAYPGASRAAEKYDIKIIYGVECYLVEGKEAEESSAGAGIKKEKNKEDSYHAVILAKNRKGLKNLYKMISQSHFKYFYKKPRIPKTLFAQLRDGLLLGTACEAGELYRAILENKNEEELIKIATFYDYLEIQPLGNNQFMIDKDIVSDIETLQDINKKIVQLGDKLGKPVVATCDVHFLDPEDEVFRRILMAGQGYSDADRQAPLFLRTTAEMMEEFMYLGEEKAYEVVVTNTNLISNKVEKIKPIPEGTFPPKIEGAEQEIEEIALKQAKQEYGNPFPDVIRKRIKKELDSIIKNGFSVMYLITMNLVRKSLKDGYMVGSRGSVGSSFAAYLTGITEVNPLQPHYICDYCKYSEFILDGSIDCGFDLPDKECPRCGKELRKDGYDIPFETFLGFEGDKEPDIDLNFSGEYQAIAHKYVEEVFGKEHVFRAGTIASIADKTAFGFVKNYLDDRGKVVPNAEINRLVKGCTGVKRTTGQHPGGIIILPQDKEIYDFTPIQRPADDTNSDTITTHFDYDFLQGSILKLDILGHDDPTTIKMLEDLTGIDAKTIPIGDSETIKIFRSIEPLGIKAEDINCEVGTIGIPEFGTRFVRQMLVETKPKTMSQLIRISGLSHGNNVWINNAQDLIKSGQATLSEVICTRDDIMLKLIYMGLPPIKAFKIMEDVRRGKGLTAEYEDIMIEHGVPDWYIESCKKIKYMFPKAHAAAYVMMAFRIAWFKVNYPIEFYTVYFTIKANDFDGGILLQDRNKIQKSIVEYESKGNSATQREKNLLTLLEAVNEMYARGCKFHSVDLYKSQAKNFIIENGDIRPPLSSLPGLGITAAQNIIEARCEKRFTSVEDLKIRGKASKTVIEILREHRCFKELPETDQISLF